MRATTANVKLTESGPQGAEGLHLAGQHPPATASDRTSDDSRRRNDRIDAEAVHDAISAMEPGGAAGETLAETEADQIRRVLAATGGNKSRAAAILGIERKTLYRKLERMKL